MCYKENYHVLESSIIWKVYDIMTNGKKNLVINLYIYKVLHFRMYIDNTVSTEIPPLTHIYQYCDINA